MGRVVHLIPETVVLILEAGCCAIVDVQGAGNAPFSVHLDCALVGSLGSLERAVVDGQVVFLSAFAVHDDAFALALECGVGNHNL